MSTSQASRRGLWLAFGGLAIVPIVGVILVLSMSEDRPKRRSRASDPTARVSETSTPDEPPIAEPTPGLRSPLTPAPALELDDFAPGPGTPTPEAPAYDDAGGGSDVNSLLEESRRIENTDPARSRELLREILNQDPDNVVALERLSTKLLIDENHAEARRLSDRCRALGGPPECDKVATLAVEQSPDMEKLAGAVKNCLVDTPQNLGCLAGMVNYHLVKDQVSEAAMYAGRLTQEAPQSVHTLFARGRIKAAGGGYREAAQLFKWACDQSYEDACYRLHLLEAEGW